MLVSISSGAATKVIDGWSLYGASKAALDHFSRHVARELEIQKETTTHVYSVAPGVVDTPCKLKYAKYQNMGSRHEIGLLICLQTIN